MHHINQYVFEHLEIYSQNIKYIPVTALTFYTTLHIIDTLSPDAGALNLMLSLQGNC
jgi:hypothetical protein